ncbi:hypothetical protein STRDD11_01864 [Streptococcus sp. DD11]|nr:hypothetical protein STRDD11_01864 [Streptococcus sp. DD11]
MIPDGRFLRSFNSFPKSFELPPGLLTVFIDYTDGVTLLSSLFYHKHKSFACLILVI